MTPCYHDPLFMPKGLGPSTCPNITSPTICMTPVGAIKRFAPKVCASTASRATRPAPTILPSISSNPAPVGLLGKPNEILLHGPEMGENNGH